MLRATIPTTAVSLDVLQLTENMIPWSCCHAGTVTCDRGRPMDIKIVASIIHDKVVPVPGLELRWAALFGSSLVLRQVAHRSSVMRWAYGA